MSDVSADGPVFGNRYELRRHIARGGMAQVYLAQDTLLDRPVALKVLFPELSVDESFVQRFRREARAAANLTHPNIVSIYDWGQGDHTYFIVMEFVDGETLSARIRRGPLDADQAAIVAIATAGALSFAHRRQVIHRDVKPGNVLIDRSGQVKVADFGIARAVGTAEDLTQAGAVMGTATYFSPEQAQGQSVDARSDVYSLGVVLYEMLAGRPPFQGDNPVAIAYKHVSEEPTPLRTINPATPPAYEAIVRKAMAKDPADRYQTADDLRQDLERFRTGQPLVGAAALLGGAAATAGDATVVAGTDATGVLAAGAGGVSPTRVQPRVGGGAPPDPVTVVEEREEGRRPVPPPERSRGWLWAILVVVLLIALGVLAYFVGRDLGAWGTRKATVPNVAHETKAAATKRLQHAGFHHLSDRVVTSRTVAKGHVVATTPAAGAHVDTSRKVVLDVSGGVGSVKVPNVVGKTQRAASADMKKHHLQVTAIHIPSPSVPLGHVMRTSPPAGTGVAPGIKVQLVVSTGPKQIVVPGLTGKSPASAAIELVNRGFNVSTKTISEPSSSVPAGQVTRTVPPAGSNERAGTTVRIYVSNGPPQVTVPKVTGDTQAQADKALTDAGLQAQFSYVTVTDPSQSNRVVSTQPGAGHSVAKGDTVTVNLGSYSAPTTLPTTTTPTTTPTTVPTTGTSGPSGTSGTTGTSGTSGPGAATPGKTPPG